MKAIAHTFLPGNGKNDSSVRAINERSGCGYKLSSIYGVPFSLSVSCMNEIS